MWQDKVKEKLVDLGYDPKWGTPSAVPFKDHIEGCHHMISTLKLRWESPQGKVMTKQWQYSNQILQKKSEKTEEIASEIEE